MIILISITVFLLLILTLFITYFSVKRQNSASVIVQWEMRLPYNLFRLETLPSFSGSVVELITIIREVSENDRKYCGKWFEIAYRT